MRELRKYFILFVALAVLDSCNAQAANEEAMGDMASALTHVSSAVDAYVRYGKPPTGIDGVTLVHKATENNPSMLEPFENYFIIARHSEKQSSVLVCDAERKQALLEDSGCTAVIFDAHHWREKPPLPCEFAIDLQTICVLPQN